MKTINLKKYSAAFFIVLFYTACKIPQIVQKQESRSTPSAFYQSQESSTIATINWKQYFSDPNLIALIDTALKNNQELNIIQQEIEIRKNEIRARKGEYLPFLRLGAGVGYEKIGEYTWRGGVEKNIENKNEPKILDSRSDFLVGARASWELDVWKKLRTAKQAAVVRYLSGIDGRNFSVTSIIAEISASYYELMALDNMLDIIQQNITIQRNALEIVKQLKDAAKVTQLAVNRFQAQLLQTQNLQYEIKQRIIATENRIHFLTGKFPGPIQRSSTQFYNVSTDSIQAGIPSQLLINRPDILQAEKELMAAKMDIKVARANFLPSFSINAQAGFQAFSAAFLINPSATVYNLAGEMMAPLINRNAIKAAYYNANAQQIQAAYKYEQTILNAHLDVLNEMAKMDNYSRSYEMKSTEVNIRTQSIDIANNLFNSARADYGEVLFTQGEVLDSKMELVEIKLKQLLAKINIYRALGGGWR